MLLLHAGKLSVGGENHHKYMSKCVLIDADKMLHKCNYAVGRSDDNN